MSAKHLSGFDVSKRSSIRRPLLALLSFGISFALWRLYMSEFNLDSDSRFKCASHTTIIEEFDWYKLEPSKDIRWSDCFGNQKCARLSLPLDYLNKDGEGTQTHIALRMIPASDKDNYKGTILVNPGGPGGSGTSFINRFGENISKIVGPSFDVLGFDPRGIGATVPKIECFDSESQYKQWNLADASMRLNATGDSIPIARGRANILARKCLQSLGGSSTSVPDAEWGLGSFMGTASVVTDMLHIVNKLGQDKLQYWGFSYGTVLGQFFAAMYPDKVGRLIIDGVYDGDEYRDNALPSDLVDTDKVANSFYTFCHQAGPLKCPLYVDTAEQIEERVRDILHRVDRTPIPIPFASSGPAIITSDFVKNEIFMATYSPVKSFGPLASRLLAIEQGDETTLQDWIDGTLSYKCDACNANPAPWMEHSSMAASATVTCGDMGILTEEPEEFLRHYERSIELSPLGGALFAKYRLQCLEWQMAAKWRYQGPLSARTSHPLLILQPTFDPVCPLNHAKRVRERFVGAGLLEQRSMGHCTISAPSKCTTKYVRDYFVNGTLPEEGALCQVDELPFVGQVDIQAQTKEDEELLEALHGLTEAAMYMKRV